MKASVTTNIPVPVVQPPTTYDVTFKDLSRMELATLKALVSPNDGYRKAAWSGPHLYALHEALRDGIEKTLGGPHTAYELIYEAYGSR